MPDITVLLYKNMNLSKMKKEKDNKFDKEFLSKFKNATELENYFSDMYKQALQAMLEGEMDNHLGYSKYERTDEKKENFRNGNSKKTVKTKLGEIPIEIPRDRNGEFTPEIVQKNQTVMGDIEDKVLSLYSIGLTTRQVEEEIKEFYGINISDTEVSRITNRILEQVKEWQSRPLDSIYPVIWLDGIYFKVKENHRLLSKAIFIVVGLNKQGNKEPLGMWINQTESAAFWMSVLDDLKKRGIKDIIISASDNLTGLTEAITAVYPNCLTQICIVHQIRNSLKYVAYKDRKEFVSMLKDVYQAPNRDTAETALEVLDIHWGKKYPAVIKSWRNNWENLTVFFDFPSDIRKMIYTTNIIENLNRVLRKYTKNRVLFPSDDSVLKAVFLTIQRLEKQWLKQKIVLWENVINQFLILYPDRIKIKI
jgi:putative transposase